MTTCTSPELDVAHANAHAHANATTHQQIEAACEQACQAIAPAWPLDRAIAVNPHWSRVGMPVRRVAARMAVLGQMQVFPTRSSQQQAWASGRIGMADLTCALATLPAAQPAGLTAAQCLQALEHPQPLPHLPLLIDVLDNDPQRHTRLSWRQAITHQVSQTCAAYFDEHQADWQPQRQQGLYAFWRDTLAHEHGIGTLMGLPDLGRAVRALPATRAETEAWVLQRLGLAPSVWADYLEAVLLTVNGWASWCAYLGWQARLEGKQDGHLRDLLAIRLAWGAILLECKDSHAATHAFAAVQAAWAQAPALLAQTEQDLLADEVWQTALEVGYQRGLASQLGGQSGVQPSAQSSGQTSGHAEQGAGGAGAVAAVPAPLEIPVQVPIQAPDYVAVEVQAAFCIDVRSEPLRRALEGVWPAVQTVGFAGFFGLPAAYTPLGTQARRPQLPGLLPPTVELTDQIVPTPASTSSPTSSATALSAGGSSLTAAPAGPTAALPSELADLAALQTAARQARQSRFGLSAQWLSASRWPSAAFSFVEAAGVGYLGQLGQWLSPSRAPRARDDLAGLPARYRAVCRPQFVGLPLPDKVSMAAGVLGAMGLRGQLAPLVALVGHGSQSANNAHAAALDCGACCGQTGEVNARSLALLLNDPAVRAGLQAQGIEVPSTTHFVAALHNTTTDEIEAFDLDLLSPAGQAHWATLQTAFAQAGDQVRRERAPLLGLNPQAAPADLLGQLQRRANDGAQTRPEWGLANNAAFVIAPRARTQGLALAGRSFLHDYAADQDADGSLLELLMTAPMLVTHWINWQYHASTCDPLRLGSGNKVLHNVVGGHIGVFEGNGGDLRIGLSKQSLHDGQRWVHEPLRLTVAIDAPAPAIERIIHKHAVVRQLVDNGWLHLWRFEQAQLLRYGQGEWLPLNLE